MTEAPTYQKLVEDKRNMDTARQQQARQQQVAQEGLAPRNEVLDNYMKKETGMGRRGLEPAAEQYTMAATQVANSAADQNEYSKIMTKAGIDGQLDPRDVLADNSVLDEDKAALLSLLQGGPQMEQAPMGLVPR